MATKQTPALVVDGRVDTVALAAYAGEVRDLVEQMRAQLDAAAVALSTVETDAPDDQEVPAAVKATTRRLAAAVDDAGRALGVVPALAAELGREAL